MIRIGAVDDDRIMLQAVGAWLAATGDIELVRSAATVEEFLRERVDVDLVLLDLNLRDGTRPADNVRQLCRDKLKVLVVSAIGDPGHMLDTQEAGAMGYVTKDNDLGQLSEAIREVAAGRDHFSHELALAISEDTRPRRPPLSDRERQVLRLYANGSTLEATARRLGMKPSTARTYLDRIRAKYAGAGHTVAPGKAGIVTIAVSEQIDPLEPRPGRGSP